MSSVPLEHPPISHRYSEPTKEQIQSPIFKKIPKVCYSHTGQQLISVCTYQRCPRRGAMCPVCQVKEHTDHLGSTWNLENYLLQIERQVHKIQPSTLSLNDYLVTFLDDLRSQKDRMIQLFTSISSLVKEMTEKSKGSYDKDIDETKTILKKLKDCEYNQDFTPKIYTLTSYFGMDPATRKIYRRNSYGELYRWKINEILLEQKEFFDSKIKLAIENLEEIEETFKKFEITNIDVMVIPTFSAVKNVVQFRPDFKAHQNWIRSVQLFNLSETEVQNLNIENLAQIAKVDPLTKQGGLFAIATSSDDMELKIWIYSPEDQEFHNMSNIPQAHSRECLSMRIHYFDAEILDRMADGTALCNNVILTAEHGLIKIWDWVSKKCINEVKTYSLYTYDFEVLKFPELGLCYAKGSKNIIQVSDLTSPQGMFMIKEINPEEQNEEITCFQKIQGIKHDFLAMAFGGASGKIKIFNPNGKCMVNIQRQQRDLAFCMTTFSLQRDKNIQQIQKEESEQKLHEILVVGSDQGCLTAYNVQNGSMVWQIPNLHNGWVRGLTSISVRDSYDFRALIFSTCENEKSLKIIDGKTGKILHTLDVFDAGLRFRSLGSLQGSLDPNVPDSTIIAAGTKSGKVYVFKIVEQ